MSTVATTGTGVDELADAIDAHLAGLDAVGTLSTRREDRWRVEVRSHMDYLLLEASRGVVSGLSAGVGAPAAVARELAAGLVGGKERDR